MTAKKPKLASVPCYICGHLFVPHYNGIQKRCSSIHCYREYHRRIKKAGREASKIIKQCVICGNQFKTNFRRKLACGPECQRKICAWRNRRTPEAMKKSYERHKKTMQKYKLAYAALKAMGINLEEIGEIK